ncbi:coiled-coil domain-containing protein 157-like [Watersipora subatra]|uniref:coiled-coil domain-containing protein 157-like n=1 Tax=Watersipora subatra TaxID=2589382 RepID=UPI00355BAA49
MTELLGNKFCVENLCKDVGDIHNVIGGLTSRLGQVNYTSWKYPDKLAMDVNISELLEMCEFDAEYEEENKISHLLLLEMVIDRLIFFIQCSNRFMDQMFNNDRAQSAIDHHSSSIGVITKKYWAKMLQLYSHNQQTNSERKLQQKKLQELQSYNQQISDELANYHQGVTHVPVNSSQGRQFSNSSVLPPITPSNTEESIAKDNSNKSSQTLETAFVPCESCHKVQNGFKAVADSMGVLCKTQGIPSSLAKYRKQLQSLDWYSANDLTRWSVEQTKDLDKINKHLSDLMSTIDPLKEELTNSITSCRKLELRVRDCQHEIQLEKQTQKDLEQIHAKKVEALAKDHSQVKADLEKQRSQLEQVKEGLQKKLNETECELELQNSKYRELDDIKKQLVLELEESKTNNTEVKRLTSILSSLEQEMSDTTDQLVQARSQLEQEQAITKSLTKRTESLQSKYDSLVRRIDEMDEENENLQSEMSALVEEKEQLETSLAEALKHSSSKTVVQGIEMEKGELKKSIKSLQETIGGLELDLNSMKERERLLVEYPDLNGPVNPDMTGTGDITADMQNQVKANELRMALLDKQNSSMRKTLRKLTKHQQAGEAAEKREEKRDKLTGCEDKMQYSSVSPMEPTALWKHSDSMAHGRGDADNQHSETKGSLYDTSMRRKDKVSRDADESMRSRSRQLPSEARPNSGVDAYIKLRKAGLLKPGADSKRSEYGNASSGESGSFCCPNCDKLYQTFSDLDIHRSYCARR